jgi:hypothetical protein
MNRIPVAKNQGSIDSFFAQKKVETPKKADNQINTELGSANPEIQAFYNSLNAAEKIAHTIALEKLGTSYDVSRTHGFIKWKKARA